jgi:hypothetical protein
MTAARASAARTRGRPLVATSAGKGSGGT